MAHYGALILAMNIVELTIRWPLGGYTESDLVVDIIFSIAGVILMLPAVTIWFFNRSKPLLTSTGYKKIDTKSAKHSRYAFFKYHRQVLLDHGFEELFDAKYDSTICTFFASSNSDLIVEVGIGNFGRCYYAARTVSEDGTMFHTRSNGLTTHPNNPESVLGDICLNKPIETLLRKHAVTLTSHLTESKTRLVILKDQIIDQLFLANRFRRGPASFLR